MGSLIAYGVAALGAVVAFQVLANNFEASEKRDCQAVRANRSVIVEQNREEADFLRPIVKANPDPVKRQQGLDYVALLERHADNLDLPLPCEVRN